MPTLTRKEGWYNRHLDGLPNTACLINLYYDGDYITCHWTPYNPPPHASKSPYLGVACLYRGKLNPYGWIDKHFFNAYDADDADFVYYNVSVNEFALIINTNYLKYVEENGLEFYFEKILGKTVVMTTRKEHPALFDGSLDVKWGE